MKVWLVVISLHALCAALCWLSEWHMSNYFKQIKYLAPPVIEHYSGII